jgi:anaphase-promoting complex subunit 5
MARYLTPANIGLLCLIELYTDSVVPTASTIPILSFIVSHLLPSSLSKARNNLANTQSGDEGRNFIISIQDFERLLSGRPSASGLPGRSLWDIFLKKLWDINSLDALHTFFERRSHLLAKTREDAQADADMGIPPPSQNMILLSRTSPFGAFVRRAQLEFARLKFHDAVNLWKSFTVYRQITFSTWKKRNPDANSWSFDAVLEEGEEEWAQASLEAFAMVAYGDLPSQNKSSDGLVSTNDVEKLLEFQIEQMQSRHGFSLYAARS